MVKKFTFLLFVCLFSFDFAYSQLLEFDFNAIPYLQVSNYNEKLIISELSVSKRFIDTNIALGNYFLDEPYIEVSGDWDEPNVSLAKYLFYSVEAKANHQYSVQNLSFEAYSTNSGPSAIAVYIDDSVLYSQSMPAATLQNIQIPVNAFNQQIKNTIKISGWDDGSRETNGGGALRIDNIVLDGMVEEIPKYDSNSVIISGNYEPSQTISSLFSAEDSLKIIDFYILDSALVDNRPTLIDSFVFCQPFSESAYPLTQIVQKANLYFCDSLQSIEATISDSTLTFANDQYIRIGQGVDSMPFFELFVWLKDTLIQDEKSLHFTLDSSRVYCNRAGSKVGYGIISTGENNLMFNVEATQIAGHLSDSIIKTGEQFSVQLKATDIKGNIDRTVNQDINLNAGLDYGALELPDNYSSTFVNGIYTQAGFSTLVSDTISIEFSSNNLLPFQDTFLCTQCINLPIVTDDLYQQWYNTNDWRFEVIDSASNDYTIVHNLHDVASTSYIAHQYENATFNNGKTVWQLNLANGDFDPTSSNRFWYYLMASEPNLLSDSIYGYAAGVNFSGSTDSLSLWRIDADGDKTLVIQSTLNWDENMEVPIEITRRNNGEWQLSYTYDGLFLQSNKKVDQYFKTLPYHGLVFQFSSTRAGELQCSDLSFYSYNQAPIMENIAVEDGQFVKLSFSEVLDSLSAKDISNYNILDENQEAIIIDQAIFNPAFSNEIKLKVDGLTTSAYQLAVTNVKDLEGFAMDTQTMAFDYAMPAFMGDLLINEVMFDCSPAVGLPEYDYIEIFNRATYPFQFEGWKIEVGSYVRTLDAMQIASNEHVIITSSAAVDELSVYGNTIVGIGSTYLTNSDRDIKLISITGALIDSVRYKPDWINDPEKEEGGWSLERIDYNNLCGTQSNWSVSVDASGGTPGSTNSVHAENLDVESPLVEECVFVSEKTLLVAFNEVMQTNSSNLNLSISSVGFPDSVLWQDDLNGFIAYFSSAFVLEQNYQISLLSYSDECNNILSDTLIERIYYAPQFGDVVFTELMYDANPSNGLPEGEYIELFNRSVYDLNLQGWSLHYDNLEKEFPEIILEPNAYLILCPVSDTLLWSAYSQTLGIISTTTLNTIGKKLQLYTNDMQLISEVDYTPGWHSDEEKENGGWSLEKTDPDNLCSGKQNWASSKANTGGTPGGLNSADANFIDNTVPKVLSVGANSSSTIIIEFSESINEMCFQNLGNFEFEQQNIVIDSVSFYGLNKSQACIYIKNTMIFGWEYQINLKNISDDCENIMPDSLVAFNYIKVEPNDIVINEIFSDPTPSMGLPDYEYIELYNRSNKAINLEGFSVQVNEKIKTLPSLQFEPNSYLILCDNDAEDAYALVGELAIITTFPSLPNDSARVQINDTAGQIINQIIYESTWYNDEDKEEGGWSLERIDPDNLCASKSNWSASINELGGTPGQLNSIYNPNQSQQALSITDYYAVDAFTMELTLSDAPSQESMLVRENYNLESIGHPERVSYLNNNTTQLLLEFNEPMAQGSNQTLFVNGLSDVCNNVMSDTSIAFVFYEVQFADVVVNEIMANPKAWYGLPDAEYIELYNNTNYDLRIRDWGLKSGVSTYAIQAVTFPKQSYAILCEADDAPNFATFGTVFEMENMPSIANAGSIQIINKIDESLAFVAYDDDWFDNDLKADGGYSLERIDINNANNLSNNWSGSDNGKGGTPGFENSIMAENPDLIAPNALFAVPIASKSLLLVFSESMDQTSIKVDDFELNSSILPKNYSWQGNEYASMLLNFEQGFEQAVPYSLQLAEHIKDLAGNGINNRAIEFMMPEPIKPKNVLINEVLFDPIDSGSDFIELYNNGSSAINLGYLRFTSRDDDSKLKSVEAISDKGYILLPQHFVVLCDNPDKVKQHYFVEKEFAFIKVENMLSLANDGGSIVLLDTLNTIIDELAYTSDMHFALLDNTKGVSIERISYQRPTMDVTNWHSAAQQVGGATPTYQNSVFDAGFENDSEINLEPEAFSPDNDGYDDVLNIHYAFNEAGFVGNVMVLNKGGYNVKTIANNELLANKGQWTWDGITDSGQKAPIGIYVIFIEVFDLKGKIKKFKKVCVVSARFD